MIPLRDSIPNIHRPTAVWTLMVLNAVVFALELWMGPELRQFVIRLFGVIPARYTMHSLGDATGSVLLDALPFLTYMFLHSGWLHFLLNMWVLWIFADNIEDVMGHGRFVVFYLLCGFAALALHILFNPTSTLPIIGASGAIGGVMGAYFVLYPHARIVTFVPIFFIPYVFELPAVVFLGFWLLVQVLSGVQGHLTAQEGGVAFWAHVGGFAAGIALMPLFRRKERCRYCYDRSRKRYVEERTGEKQGISSGDHWFGGF